MGVVTEGEATMQPEVDGLERCHKDRTQGLAEMGGGRGQRLAQMTGLSAWADCGEGEKAEFCLGETRVPGPVTPWGQGGADPFSP